jgi:hypothetical protein
LFGGVVPNLFILSIERNGNELYIQNVITKGETGKKTCSSPKAVYIKPGWNPTVMFIFKQGKCDNVSGTELK